VPLHFSVGANRWDSLLQLLKGNPSPDDAQSRAPGAHELAAPITAAP
jgi:hypothetical protein